MRMLGRWSFYPVGNCDCCRKDKKTIRNREEQQWMQDYKEEMQEAGVEPHLYRKEK